MQVDEVDLCGICAAADRYDEKLLLWLIVGALG
jgi:hypothetical protein